MIKKLQFFAVAFLFSTPVLQALSAATMEVVRPVYNGTEYKSVTSPGLRIPDKYSVAPEACNPNRGVASGSLFTGIRIPDDTNAMPVDKHLLMGTITGTTAYCTGETLQLAFESTEEWEYVEWLLPDYTGIPGYQLEVPNLTAANAGEYKIWAHHWSGTVYPFSVTVTVQPTAMPMQQRTVVLCGPGVQVTATAGYTSYVWKDNGGGIIGNNQHITLTAAGNYTVTATRNCEVLTEEITVIPFVEMTTHPLAAFGETVTCPNDGEELVTILLCSAGDSRHITIPITDVQDIIWEQLDESSCTGSGLENCAAKGSECVWIERAVGNSFTANTAGQWRVTIYYQNGCFKPYYFNVSSNTMNPGVVTTPVDCTVSAAVNGTIHFINMPATGYQYKVVDPLNAAVVFDWQDSPEFNTVPPGNYTGYVRAGTGVVPGSCIATLQDITVEHLQQGYMEVLLTPPACGRSEISTALLNWAGNTAAMRFELWKDGSLLLLSPYLSTQKYHTFLNLSAGTYTVKYTGGDCTNGEQVVTITTTSEPIEAVANLTAPLTCDAAVVTIAVAGGVAPFTYTLPGRPTQAAPEFAIADPGTYTVTIEDTNGCTTTAGITLNRITPEYTITTVQPLCGGVFANGSISVNLSNSHGFPIAYRVHEGSIGNPVYQDSGIFPNLTPNDYHVQLRYRIGTAADGAPLYCETVPEPVVIESASNLEVGTAMLQELTCTTLGSIEFYDPVGGTPPYEYRLGDSGTFQSNPVFTNLAAGTYTTYIRDANGCIAPGDSWILEPVSPPTGLTFTTTPLGCNSVAVALAVTGGTAPFTYGIIAPTLIGNGNDPLFASLAPGVYTFKVTDSKGCSYTQNHEIVGGIPIQLIEFTGENVRCGDDGSIAFKVMDHGDGHLFSYKLNSDAIVTGQTPGVSITLPSLAPGNYTLLVTDEVTGCTATAAVTIGGTASTLALVAHPAAISCIHGSVVLVGSGGAPGVRYYTVQFPDGGTIVGPQTHNVFDFLNVEGMYTATITDSRGCSTSVDFRINRALPLTAALQQTVCYDTTNGATVELEGAGGVAPLYYSSNGGGSYQASPVFTGLAPGDYTFVVRDANWCDVGISHTIYPEFIATVTVTNIASCVPGGGGGIPIGRIQFAVSGGNPAGYQYALQQMPGGTISYLPMPASKIIIVNTIGSYTVWVKDASGCALSFPITITQNLPITVIETHTNVACSAYSNGTITVTATGGNNGNYIYSMDGKPAHPATQNTFTGLSAGTYTIRVADYPGTYCPGIIIVTIEGPEPLTAEVGISKEGSCRADNRSEIRLTNVSGGTPPYTYQIGGGSFGSSNAGYLGAGTHTVWIRDAAGCTLSRNITIDPPVAAPTITLDKQEMCDGTAILTVTPSNSTDFTYEYSLDGNSAQPGNVFTDVVQGPHVVTAQYSSSTPSAPGILVKETFGTGANKPLPNIDPSYCYNAQAGPDGCTAGLNLMPGEYMVTNTITPIVTNWIVRPDHTGDAQGRFLAVNLGNTDSVLYEKEITNSLPNQDITVTLAALNLRNSTTTGTFPDIAIQLVDATGTLIQESHTGGIPNNEDWNNYSVTLQPGMHTNLKVVLRSYTTGGTENAIALDDIQVTQLPETCPGTLTASVVVADNTFRAEIVSLTHLSCNSRWDDGKAFVSVANFGTPADNMYGFTLDNGITWNGDANEIIQLTNLPAGDHVILIKNSYTDGTCFITLNFTITQPDPIEVTVDVTDKTCISGGSVVINATGGTTPYQYTLSGPNGNISSSVPYFNNLANPGIHTVTVETTTYGCIATATFEITEPVPPVLTLDPASYLCFDETGRKRIVLAVSGGKAPFSYSYWGSPYQSSPEFTVYFHYITHIFTVRDANGCIGTFILEHFGPIVPTVVLVKPLECTTTAAAEIMVTHFNGYENDVLYWQVAIDGGDYGPIQPVPDDFETAGLIYTTTTPGDYKFQLTNKYNCTKESDAVIITPATPPEITAVTQIQEIQCHGEAIAAITVDVTYTAPDYTLQVLNTTTGTNYGNQTWGLAAGVYEITAIDDYNCTAVTHFTITEPDPVAFNFTAVPITCDVAAGGIKRGEIIINGVTGGTGSYTYYLHNSLGTLVDSFGPTTATDHTFDILVFGFYRVAIIDSNGCTHFEENIKIASPPDNLDIEIDPVVTDCISGGTATVTVGAAAISPGPFFFAIYTWPEPVYPDPAFVASDPGTPLTKTFTGLASGVTYTFMVYDASTNCYYYEQAAVPIPSLSTLKATLDVVGNVSCTGNADGKISFTLTDYAIDATSVSYQVYYALNNTAAGPLETTSTLAGAPITVSNYGPLAPGSYYLLFTENDGAANGCCTTSNNFTITESVQALEVTAAVLQNDNCGLNKGILTATAQYGTAPYEYQWTIATAPAPVLATWAGSSPNTFAAEAGSYIVYVKDANNCITASTVVVLDEDPAPVISAVLTNSCESTEGTYSVLLTLDTEGIAPYWLSLDGATAIGPVSFPHTLTNLNSGSHTIAVTDTNSCGTPITLEIKAPLVLSATVQLTDCTADDGAITAMTTGGSGTYEYQLEDGSGISTAFQPTALFPDLASGDYVLRVRDTTTLCSAFIPVTLSAPAPVMFDATTVPVGCFGSADGRLTVAMVVGSTDFPYEYSKDGGTTWQPDPLFINLPAGDHVISVKSARNCVASMTFTIGTPALMELVPAAITVTEFACTSGNVMQTAMITIDPDQITGGSGTYVRYVFREAVSDSLLQDGPNPVYVALGTGGGSYSITVYDTNGCEATATAVIAAFDSLDSVSVVVVTPITCVADATISINAVTGLGDLSILEYSKDNGANWQDSAIFANLGIGNHSFQIRHKVTGCRLYAVHDIVSPNVFTIDINTISQVVCAGTNTGAVTFSVNDTGYTGGFQWEIFESDGTPTGLSGSQPDQGPTLAIALGAGTYMVTVILNGTPFCTQELEFAIAAPVGCVLNATIAVQEISCTGDDGSIGITATGGWGDYRYYVGIAPPTAAAYTVTALWEGLGAGTYQVWIRDAGGCALQLPDVALIHPTPITANLEVTNQQCHGLDGSIEVTTVLGGAGANYQYQLIKDGSPQGTAQASSVFSGLDAGIYAVVVSDTWNCTTTTTTVVLLERLLLDSVVDKMIDCDAIQPGAAITATASGGSGNFDYTLHYPDGTTATNTTGIFTGMTDAGSYTIMVKDTVTGCENSQAHTVDVPVPVTFDAVATPVSCFAGADGRIDIALLPGNNNPDYQYSINDGPLQNSPVFTGLNSGTYTVKVVSARHCFAVETFTIIEPTAVVASATINDFGCTPGNMPSPAVIVLDGSGGTPDYRYSIDGTFFYSNATFTVYDTGTAQAITGYVKDANGCIATTTIVLDPLVPMTTPVIVPVTALTCTNDAVVEINVTGGSGSFLYQLLPSGIPQAGNQVTLPAVGAYSIKISDAVSGCYRMAYYTITDFERIGVTATTKKQITCYGDRNGVIEISISDYSGPYTFVVRDGSGASVANGTGTTTVNPMEIPGLDAGNYTVAVTATDTPFCTAVSNLVGISTPISALSVELALTSAVHCDATGGAIVANATGGWLGYTYQFTDTITGTILQPYSANPVLGNPTTGNYTVTVRDLEGCTATATITLALPAPIIVQATASTAAIACFGDHTVTITAVASGGEGANYQYSLLHTDTGLVTGPQSSPVFGGLGAGTYTVTAVDTWNCSGTSSTVTVVSPDELVAELVVSLPLGCLSSAQISIVATGGTAPYSYSTDGLSYATLDTFTVGPGTYQYYVRDANNCEAMTQQLLIPPIPVLDIALDLSGATISCAGDSAAQIVANATGGVGNYTYTLIDSTTDNVVGGPQLTGLFTGLGSGTYTVIVNSGDCTHVSETIVIAAPVPLVVTATLTMIQCAGATTGQISSTATGGTGTLQFAITPNLDQWQPGSTFENLAAGTYGIKVQDANGCYDYQEYTITEPAPLEAILFIESEEACSGTNTGSIRVEASGGMAPYATSLNSNFAGDFVVGRILFDNLSGGQEYTIHIRDANGCIVIRTITLAAPVILEAEPVVTYSCVNNLPAHEVRIVVNPEAVGDVLYAVDTGVYQNENIFTNLNYGPHQFHVRHTGGCEITRWFVIERRDPIIALAVVTPVICGNDSDGSITMVVSAGTAPYEYAISPNPTAYGASNVFEGLAVGDYTVWVRDTNGCVLERQVTVNGPAALVATLVTVVPEVCAGEEDGAIAIAITGGVAPYATSLNDGPFVTGQLEFLELSGGQLHHIAVRDANGCTTAIEVPMIAATTIEARAEIIYGCAQNSQSNTITIHVNPEVSADVVYTHNGLSQFENVFTDWSPGIHTVVIGHTGGCSKEVTVVVVAVEVLTVTAAEDGLNTIRVTASGGLPGYRYYFNGQDNGTNPVFRISASGNYEVKVVDANGCEAIILLEMTFIPIEIPNFFTPNSDGENDTWTPRNIDNYPAISTAIYDRAGRKIATIRIGESWNGIYDGNPLPSGDYWYVVSLNDGTNRELVGHVTLYR